jgi:hypothetical protein
MSAERRLQRAVTRWLATQPDVWALKVHGGPMQRVGVPDFLLCVNGCFLAVELKAPEGVVSTRQAHEISLIRTAGGVAGISRSLHEFQDLVHLARSRGVAYDQGGAYAR